MVIKSLKLKNYRNYELLDMTFDSKTNILFKRYKINMLGV